MNCNICLKEESGISCRGEGQTCSSFAMSKTAVRKLHWHSKLKDSFVPLVGSSADLGMAIGGGADYAEFPFVTSAPGGGLTVGDVILEIGGTPVLGMTLGDVRGVLSSCPHPVRIKTVSPGSSLCKDLRLYLSKCFTPGSVDSQLQQVIRENLYLRAVPCTSRKPRDGEISGVDYNFVSVEEFFALEESGALLESGKFKGNYYGTPRPVHISSESPPITYQEHRNLLKKFRTRSKSLSNLEKALEEGVEEGDNSEGDSAPPGVRNTAPLIRHSPGRPRGHSAGEGGALEHLEGLGGASRAGGARSRAGMADRWEQAFSDPGQPYYVAHNPKRSSWQSMRGMSRETLYKNELLGFTDEPEDLRGFPVHTCIFKGPRGFGFNVVGGTGPHEFLQVYSVTSDGPSALKTADILVYVGDACVLGVSHKQVVELLKAVPAGHSVDVEVRRGYPMLYNPDGCPKPLHQAMTSHRDTMRSPTTTQPQSLHHPHHRSHGRPRLSSASSLGRHSHHDGDGYGYGERSYMEPGVLRGLDANGNAHAGSRSAPPYRRSSASNADSAVPVRLPRSLRRLQSLDQNLASQSDSEVVSALGSHRASMIRNYNNNSLSEPPRPSRYKSSESDLSTCTVPGSRLPVPHPSERRPSSSSGGPRSPRSPHRASQSYSHLRPQGAHLRPPPTQDPSPLRGHNGYRSASPTSVSSSPGALGNGGGGWAAGGGELVPVALAQSEGDLGFSMTAGGLGGEVTVVKRVWDRRQCSSLQPGDAIVKINGADVQTLSFAQVQRVLLEHTKLGEVVLLVYRGGHYPSSASPSSPRRLPPPLLHPPPPPGGSPSDEVFTSPPVVLLPRPHSALSVPSPPAARRSALVQSTSFLESIPVTLTMEPRDWMNTGLEEEGDAAVPPRAGSAQGKRGAGDRPRVPRGFDVELKRKAGEGFGFVIASQDVENGKAASLLPHRFVTVRRGSPAARSGQIRQGDRLEAVEGRSVVALPHRELSHLLRRAGNTLRLTIVPRPSTYTSSLTESAEYDPSNRSGKGHRSRPKQDSRYYSVDLDRGPTGFGFSLRGGSEYNMGLYVLGLMEGGPASRSHKIQVSDQLVEINGDSTAGITHSQAVEHIRRGGQRIHLVLKRGNGYVPDYGRERRVTPPPLAPQLRQQSVAAVAPARQRGRSSKSRSRARSSSERREKKTKNNEKKEQGGGRERSRRRRHKSEGEGGGSRAGGPDSELGGGRERGEEGEEQEEEGGKDKARIKSSKASGSRRRRKGGRRTQSLPRDTLWRYDEDEDEDGGDGGDNEVNGGRGWGRSRERRRSTSQETRTQSRGRSGPAQERPAERRVREEVELREEAVREEAVREEPVPEVAVREQAVPEGAEREERWGGGEEEEPEDPTEHAALPIPQPNQKLPQPKPPREQSHREGSRDEEDGDGDEEDGETAREREAVWEDWRRGRVGGGLPVVRSEESLPGPGPPLSRRRPFTFLTSMQSLNAHQNGLDGADSEGWDSDSGASQSDGSVSAASISGLSLASRTGLLPGPWLNPSRVRLAQMMEDN